MLELSTVLFCTRQVNGKEKVMWRPSPLRGGLLQ